MIRRQAVVLYEHGEDSRPYGTAYIRLLRPLTHPRLADLIEVTPALDYHGQAAEVVIVDRLWRPDVTLELAERLVTQVRRSGAQLLYSLDDNLMDLTTAVVPWFEPRHRDVCEYFLRAADGVIVSTPPLQVRVAAYNSRVALVPNMLDERLLPPRWLQRATRLIPRTSLVIGYMGTFSHDGDLLMILPALRAVCERYRGRVTLQIIGAVARRETWELLRDLPVTVIPLTADRAAYPKFMYWFTRLRWDVALAPLIDSPFTRCKSDIKFLDYAALGVAGIYSRVPAYESSVRHLETGWVAENTIEAWQSALTALMANRQLRTKLARTAGRYLHTQRTLATGAARWLATLNKLLDRSPENSVAETNLGAGTCT